MKIGKEASGQERTILAAIVCDDAVCGRVAAVWRPGLVRSRWVARVAQWALDYFGKYSKAPGSDLARVFAAWAAKNPDHEETEVIENWLAGVSREWEERPARSSDYLIDMAGKYFNEVALARLADMIQGALDTDDGQGAQDALDEYRTINLGTGAAVDLFLDREVYTDAFREEDEDIVEYPGALGRFFAGALCRDALVAFMAPEKRGKTFWLLDLAYRAACQRRRVLFFQAGDMTQRQFAKRFAARVVCKPLRPRKYLYPTEIKRGKDDKVATVTHERRQSKDDLDWQAVFKKATHIHQKRIVTPGSFFKLSTHPNNSLAISDISAAISRYGVEENWVPDVVVIDYADLLLMKGADRDFRNATNEAWKELRALSQRLHCLVVTATQADAASYGAQLIRKKNFSEDKRKIAHVTGLIGINASTDEEKSGIYRLNWVARREGRFREGSCVHVAHCLDVANPAVRSTF